MMNVVGTSIESVTRTILGKLQAVAYFEKLGIEFDLPISDILNGIEKSYDVEYKEQMCASLEHYLIDQSRYKYQLGAPSAGLIGDIVKTIYSKRNYLIKCNPKTRQKHLLKIISAVVEEEEAKIHKLNKQCEQALARAESIVRNYGLKSIAPELADMYSNMEITHCGSKSYLKFSNPTKCIQYVSTGSLGTPNLQGVVSSCPTTLTKHKRNPLSRLVPFLPNKTQESQDLPKTAPSQSQPPVGEEHQTEECVQEMEVTSLISDMPSQQVLQTSLAQSQSGLNMTLPSTPLKSRPFNYLFLAVSRIYSAAHIKEFSLNLRQALMNRMKPFGRLKAHLAALSRTLPIGTQLAQTSQSTMQQSHTKTTPQDLLKPKYLTDKTGLDSPTATSQSTPLMMRTNRIRLHPPTQLNVLTHRRRYQRLRQLCPLARIVTS
jgi:hypothetical protein